MRDPPASPVAKALRAGEERAPLAYNDARHGFRLTDETYTLPPVRSW